MKVVTHIGLTVTDIERSISFYRDIMKMTFVGEMKMEGKETDLLFGENHVTARVAYLKTKEQGPDIELIQFLHRNIAPDKASLFKPSVSEICFEVDNIQEWYEDFKRKGVDCLSEPQEFDSSEYGFGRSKALYFKDPDGIILELMEYL